MPPLVIVPDSGRSIAPMRCSKVDLPDPDGPVRAVTLPGSMVRLTSCAAVIRGSWPPPYCLQTPARASEAALGLIGMNHSSASSKAAGSLRSSRAGNAAAATVTAVPMAIAASPAASSRTGCWPANNAAPVSPRAVPVAEPPAR